MKLFFLVVLFLIPFSLFSRGDDFLILKNEMIFKGKVKKIDKSAVRFKTVSGSYWIPSGVIYYVKLDNPENGILQNFFRKRDSKISRDDSGQEEDTQTLIYKGYGIIGNDSYLKGISLLTPQDDDPRHRQIAENFLQLNEKTFSDPIQLKRYDQKVKLNFARNTGIAVGSILFFSFLEKMFFVAN